MVQHGRLRRPEQGEEVLSTRGRSAIVAGHETVVWYSVTFTHELQTLTMARLVYGLSQSLDGYVDHLKLGPPAPDAFDHFIELVRGASGLIYGRRTYEIVRYWDDDVPGWDDGDRAFASVWRGKPKWVVSRSRASIGPNATLVSDDVVGTIRRLKDELPGEILVGGPLLAHSLAQARLVDEYRLYLRPVVLGSGTPFFAGARPPLQFVGSDVIADGLLRLTYIPA